MADRYPLIANSSANQIQELGASDNLQMAGSGIAGGLNITSGITTVADTTEATSATTGALVVSGGVGIAKSLEVGGNISAGGTITYEDVTNVDSIGIVTAGAGLYVGRTAIGATFTTHGHGILAGVVTATDFQNADGDSAFAVRDTWLFL